MLLLLQLIPVLSLLSLPVFVSGSRLEDQILSGKEVQLTRMTVSVGDPSTAAYAVHVDDKDVGMPELIAIARPNPLSYSIVPTVQLSPFPLVKLQKYDSSSSSEFSGIALPPQVPPLYVMNARTTTLGVACVFGVTSNGVVVCICDGGKKVYLNEPGLVAGTMYVRTGDPTSSKPYHSTNVQAWTGTPGSLKTSFLLDPSLLNFYIGTMTRLVGLAYQQPKRRIDSKGDFQEPVAEGKSDVEPPRHGSPPPLPPGSKAAIVQRMKSLGVSIRVPPPARTMPESSLSHQSTTEVDSLVRSSSSNIEPPKARSGPPPRPTSSGRPEPPPHPESPSKFGPPPRPVSTSPHGPSRTPPPRPGHPIAPGSKQLVDVESPVAEESISGSPSSASQSRGRPAFGVPMFGPSSFHSQSK